MKKKFYLWMMVLALISLASCSSDDKDGSIGNVKFGSVSLKGSNIKGAKSLAVASKTSATRGGELTRAAGDATQVDALYKVSDDGKFIEVSYTFNLEVEEGEGDDVQTVIQQVQQKLKIKPNFIFKVGDDYLWLANCFYEIPDYADMAENGVKKALTTIRDEFNTAHRAQHGAHYIIRKSDGAFFQWEPADGAPNPMDDGYNPQSMLNGWFHAVGSDFYVREGGYKRGTQGWTGRVVKVSASGSTLGSQEVIPSSENITRILPAGNNFCLIKSDGQHRPTPYFYFTQTRQVVPLQTPTENVDGEVYWSAISLAGKVYAMRNYHRGDANPGANILSFYKVNVSGNTASVGDKITEMETSVGFDDDKFFGVGYVSDNATFTFFSQDYTNSWSGQISTFDSVKGTINTRALPQHYNDNYNMYVEGIACSEATSQGFYLCDLSKDEAEYITLDWSQASAWQSMFTKMEAVHFEAANMSLKYQCTTTDNKTVVAWVPISGANRGKVKILTDADGNANYDVKVVVDM